MDIKHGECYRSVAVLLPPLLFEWMNGDGVGYELNPVVG